jgi:hypothetical protein
LATPLYHINNKKQGRADKLKEELMDNMGIEEEVLGKLGDHDKKLSEHEVILNNHSEKITELQMKDIGFEGRFNNLDNQIGEIKGTLVRMENSSLQSSTLLLNALTQIATGNSKSSNDIAKSEVKGENEITKIKITSRTKIIIQIIVVVGTIVGAYFSARYGVSVK